jgi:phosphoglycolate phosphatase-like HAD superfamily hydrolase
MGSSSQLMQKYFGIEPFPTKVYMEGKTFRWILKERLKEAGIENPDKDPRFYPALNDVSSIVESIKKGIKIEKIPHVEELINMLTQKGYYVGLLTGNTEESAKVKLEHVDLWKYFKIGAFGSEVDQRYELVSLALKDAKDKTGITFRKKQVYLIGDTREDITCAKQGKVKIISVATGKETLDQLRAEKPDFLFPDFSNLEGIVSAIK